MEDSIWMQRRSIASLMAYYVQCATTQTVRSTYASKFFWELCQVQFGLLTIMTFVTCNVHNEPSISDKMASYDVIHGRE